MSLLNQMISMAGGPEKVLQLLLPQIPHLENMIAQAMARQTAEECPEEWQWVEYSLKDIPITGSETMRTLVVKSYARLANGIKESSAPVEKYTLEDFIGKLLTSNKPKQKALKKPNHEG